MSTSKRVEKPRPAERATSQESTSTSVFREIETALLLEPLDAARSTLDEDKLQRLIVSIRAMGIIEPLLVFPEGRSFRVAAGHRRLIAARAIGLRTCPCRVYHDGEDIGEALKHHENAMREDLNAAEEARHFLKLLEKSAGGDVDRLCELVQERREYVEARLLLIQGDARVFQALTDSAISIGVAQELNRVNDPASRMMFLESAMSNGASVRMVRDWRLRINAQDALSSGEVVMDHSHDFQPVQPSAAQTLSCYLCSGSEDTHEMEILYVHRSCARAQQRMFERQAAAENQPEGSV